MKREPQSMWFVPINAGNEFALLIKTSTPVLKHISRGCRVRLSASVVEIGVAHFLATGLTIYDDPIAPIIICGIEREAEEHEALVRALRSGTFSTYFFDELSRPVSRAQCIVRATESSSLLAQIGSVDALYTGPFNGTVAEALDRFEGTLDPQLAPATHRSVDLSHSELSFGPMKDIEIIAIGLNEVGSTSLLKDDEGPGLEQASWQLLEELYGSNLYRSPQVGDGSEKRELTDVFTTDPYAALLIEAKASAVLSVSETRSTTRRASSIQKQIDKGIDQLCGAIKRVRNKDPLWTSVGGAIAYPALPLLLHAIVVVSDMHPNLDWTGIRDQLLAASKKLAAPFHVIDLQELRTLVAVSSTPEQIGLQLIRRYAAIANGTHALVRARFGPPIDH